ncbi:MAG: Crp/Fnr family transcriptional regulator, partial [Rhodospirillales bacterium]|nr:Crp/Fnr family transcriptional regulator [Rhodospirillales bacterium]
MTEQLVSRLVPISSGAGIARCEACLANGILVCSAIGDRDVARLERAARTLDVPAGVAFIHEGDAARSFYNLCGGTVRLFKALPDGRRQIVGFARPGYFLGIAPSGTYAFSAETIELCRLCRFSRTDLMSLLDDIPTLERRIFEHTAHELTIARDQILLLGRKTAKERLATFLLAWSTETQPCGHPV